LNPTPTDAMDAVVLTARIAEAFADAPLPATFVSHQCPDCESVRAAFGRRRWNEIPGNSIREHHDALPLLTPEAFVFVIPAFLIAAVREPLGDIASTVLYSLQPSGNRRGSPFTARQRSVLLEVGEWLAERESWGVDMGRIRKYWG
jgi:hypothetical protein